MVAPTSRIFAATALAIGLLILHGVTRSLPPWGDEEHFLSTVRLFGDGMSVELLRTYPEMSGPLTFALYAGWGSLVGFGTEQLRLLAPLLSGLTIALFFAALGRWRVVGGLRWGAAALVLFNPYFIGLSAFVFTDMAALLGLAVVMYSVAAGRPWLAAFGLATATLARQYLVFLAPALVISAFLAPREPPAFRVRWVLAAVAGLLPLGVMVRLWHGHLAPSNGLRDVYLADGFRFDPHALSLYLASPAIYLLPLVVLALTSAHGRGRGRALVVGAVLATVVVVWPVEPSIAQTREGAFTVGFAHAALSRVMPRPLVTGVFWVGAGMWIAALAVGAGRMSRESRRSEWRVQDPFLWAALACFLLLMPFSYMPWEKYALPQLMLTIPLLARSLSRPAPQP